MELVKLQAAFKDYLWGGHKLVDNYNQKSDLNIVAESWELSNHHDGNSIILNGDLKGKTFEEYLQWYGKQVWGTDCLKYDKFPIMIKLIDAKEALSIQVHPDDEYALKNEHEYGKNEMWYILDCDEDAYIYFGVKKAISKEELKKAIENDTVCDLLQKVKVHPGDCFFIEAGTIHAIGAGIVLAEIQQCSNSTYRVYDFHRLGVDGKPRALHIDKAIDVARLTPNSNVGKCESDTIYKDGYTYQIMTTSKYFQSIRYDIEEELTLTATTSSFNSILIIEGHGQIICGNELVNVEKGDSIFIPAGMGDYTIKGKLSMIKTSV